MEEGSRGLGLEAAARRALGLVIGDATEHKARLMLSGFGDGAPSRAVNTRLAGNGPNDLMREGSLRCRTARVRKAYAAIAGRPLPARLDLISALSGLAASLPPASDRPVNVVLVGSALNTVAADLRRPAVRGHPARGINALARKGLNFRCEGWRVHMVGAAARRGAALAPAADAQLREWWRRYLHHCGGALVSYAPRLTAFPGGAELPPADRSLIPLKIDREGNRVRATLSGDVLFALESADLRPAAGPVLRRLLSALRASRGPVNVAGYTDSTGPEAVNLPLSRARARTVADWLHAKAGLPPARLRAHGLGAADPVASNASATGRAKNRRVVVTIFGGG